MRSKQRKANLSEVTRFRVIKPSFDCEPLLYSPTESEKQLERQCG